MQPVIYADLRCLQDPKYRVRGIGRHIAALFRTRRHSALSTCKAIGLTDPNSPKLPAEIASLVDEVRCSSNPCMNGVPGLFIDGTPMTHDTRFSLRFLNHPAFFSAAVLYDFIPLDWPGYLPTVPQRIDYLAKIARLRKFDWFLPISEYTAWRASELLNVPRKRMHVTGASVRRSFYEFRDRLGSGSPPPDENTSYFVIVVATDVRKNPAVAVKAVRHLNLVYGRRIPLKIIGHYDDAYKHSLLRHAAHAEGAGFLEFCTDVDDEELVRLYSGAIATIAPSHIEGFSLPVVESSVCGCPVVASTCAAHLELIDQPEALFPSDDAAALCERLDALLNDPGLRASLIKAQACLSAKFHEDAVGKRFWGALEAAIDNRPNVAVISRRKKPRLAFLSPFPPDRSGVARYTAMTIYAGESLFHSDLYSDAPRPLLVEGNFRDAGPVSVAPLVSGQYDAIVSVIGNSTFHTRIFEFLERCGGPCILHDARLTQVYREILGLEEFLKLAARLTGRPVSLEEAHNWLQDRDPATLFLEGIIDRASPLIVHTRTQQEQIKKRHGVECHVAPCCPTIYFSEADLTISAKESARERNSISSGTFVVSTFGLVVPDKGMETCILALELLRSWNIPAELHFVGSAHVFKDQLDRIACLYGIDAHVHCTSGFVDDTLYRDFLIASDVAVQLRTFAFGQFSAALADCISAGLPAVATADLAHSCDAPPYISIVPDRFSPLQVAENLAQIWEDRTHRGCLEDARMAYLQTHNYEYYAKRLVEILGIG